MNISFEIGEAEVKRVQEVQATMLHLNPNWQTKTLDEFACLAFVHGLEALEKGCAIMEHEGYQSSRLQ